MYSDQECEDYQVIIYVTGNYESILHELQLFVAERGMCFSCERLDYVYTHGRESGAKVTAINYPRFPMDRGIKTMMCINVAKLLIEKLGMGSATITNGKKAYYFSRRGD